MLDIAEVHNGYEVKFAYKPYLVQAIKQIPGAIFNGAKKHWYVPQASGPALLNWASTFGKHVTHRCVQQITEPPPLPELDRPVPDFFYHRSKEAKGEPCHVMPYQTRGVAYMLQKKRVIAGDDMGLGKTAQAILTAVMSGAKCILVICPATLRENWRREWKEWTGWHSMILSDRVKTSWPQFYNVGMIKVFICNYESLKKYFVERIDKHVDENGKEKPLRLNHIHFKPTLDLFDCVIIDEVHRCKDGRRQVSKFCMGITKNKPMVLALTGTPVQNKPADLISQLYIIDQLKVFGGYKQFVDRYCQGYSQASNLKELNNLLQHHCFYRRLKKDVLQDFPDKMRNIIRVEITNRDEYMKAEDNLRRYLKENLNKSEGEINKALRGEAMVQIGILKKIAARGKMEHVISHIQEVVASEEKIVVFAWHLELVRELQKMIPGSVAVTGDVSMEERQRAVDSFQNDPSVQVIICNIKAGGVGITLTASSRVLFLELPWTPADADQCEDRCWRIGAKNNVDVLYALGYETIDEHIYSIIDKKRNIVKQVTGAEADIETNVVDEFINLFMNERNP